MEFHQYDVYEGRCPRCGMMTPIRLYDTSLTREVSLAWCAGTHRSPDGKACGIGFQVVCDDPLTYAAKLLAHAIEVLNERG